VKSPFSHNALFGFTVGLLTTFIAFLHPLRAPEPSTGSWVESSTQMELLQRQNTHSAPAIVRYAGLYGITAPGSAGCD
jgi:hypothetical protein